MNPNRILPDLQCSLVCEDIRQEINGNFILAGVLSFVRVPQLPVTAFRLYVFNRWTAGVGQFVEVVRLIAPDQSTVVRQGNPLKFSLEDPAQSMTNVTLLQQVQFTVPGVYFVEVLVEDVMKLRYPLPLVLAPPRKPGTAPADRPAPETPAEPGSPPPAPGPGTSPGLTG